ncbi:MAG: site-2 protease family protein [Pseudolabrys sp.]
MSWSLNIGRVAGTIVRIHITFLLFLAWIFAASYAASGAATAWDTLAFVVLLFLCVLLHEFGHIFTARAFGVTTPYVTLLPIGGVAQLERIPEEPYEEFLIAIAGPLVNVEVSMIDRLAIVNLFLALFNLIPAFPMDGGRVLRAALATKWGYVRATEISATVGQFVAFALGFIGLMYNPLLIFIAIFVYLAAASESHMVALRAASHGVPVSHAMVTHFEALSPEGHLDDAVQTLLQTGQGEFPVVNTADRPVGVLDRGALIRALKTLGPDARVADAMSPEFPTVGHRITLEQAFKVLQEKGVPAIGVTDADGKLVGLVTGETIAEMMMLRDALPQGPRLGPWGRAQGA